MSEDFFIQRELYLSELSLTTSELSLSLSPSLGGLWAVQWKSATNRKIVQFKCAILCFYFHIWLGFYYHFAWWCWMYLCIACASIIFSGERFFSFAFEFLSNIKMNSFIFDARISCSSFISYLLLFPFLHERKSWERYSFQFIFYSLFFGYTKALFLILNWDFYWLYLMHKREAHT